MKAILIHGMPSKEEYYSSDKSPSNSHWFPWLQNKLLQLDIFTQTPEMPKPYLPAYSDWENTLKQFGIDEETILVGHSCGAGFLLKYLSQNKLPFKHLFLVAPYIDPTNYIGNNFFEDVFLYKSDENKISIFFSTDDDEDIVNSYKQIKEVYPNARSTVFSDKGHFCFGDLHTEEFPELLTEIKKVI